MLQIQAWHWSSAPPWMLITEVTLRLFGVQQLWHVADGWHHGTVSAVLAGVCLLLF